MSANVLIINGGSSSIKIALYTFGDPPQVLLSGKVEHLGNADAVVTIKGADGKQLLRQSIGPADHVHATSRLVDELQKQFGQLAVAAVGHRVVHGGPRYQQAQLITNAVIEDLKRLSPLDPDHMPAALAIIDVLMRRFANVPHVACFDTAFHHDLPRVAQLLPLPRRYEAVGVRRYGFHGLSYSFLLEELPRIAGSTATLGRVILAHLGAGASLAAVRDGRCIDTSMAFTPTSGLMMATRSGDLDPGVLFYLLRHENMNVDQLDELINQQSGLLGLAETSADMPDLLVRQVSDPRAADAVAVFCYHVTKWIGAFAAALGGLDTLVFTGGIGENAPEIRARICARLGFLSLVIDPDRNAANASAISSDVSKVAAWVIPTNEELMIAKSVCRLMAK